MSLIGCPPPPLVVASPPTITYCGQAASGSNSTSYTFASRAIGAESATRLVVVGVISNNNAGTPGAAPSGVTIAGDAMTSDGSTLGTVSNEVGLSFWRRVVASGTTADIVVSFSDGQVRCGIVIFTVEGYESATPVSESGSTVAADGFSTAISLAFATSSRQAGIVIGGLSTGITDSSNSCVLTNATEKADFRLETFYDYAAVGGLIAPGLSADIVATWSLPGHRAIRAIKWQ